MGPEMDPRQKTRGKPVKNSVLETHRGFEAIKSAGGC